MVGGWWKQASSISDLIQGSGLSAAMHGETNSSPSRSMGHFSFLCL